MQNRSGIPDVLGHALQADPSLPKQSIAPLAAANRLAAAPVAFAPGEQFDYAHANWILVRAIIAHLDARSPETSLVKRVLEPAGMHDSQPFSGQPGNHRIVQPSTPVRPLPDFMLCSGGLLSTPHDLLRLLRFPHAQAEWPDAIVQALMTISTVDEHYSLGGRYRLVGDTQNHLVSWQSGANGAFRVIAIYDPKRALGFAAATSDGQDLTPLVNTWLAASY